MLQYSLSSLVNNGADVYLALAFVAYEAQGAVY